jgi:hypothetical protein
MSQEQLQDDTISLTGVKNFIKAGLRGWFAFVAFIGLTFSKGKWIILLGLVIGLSLGYLYHVIRPAYFRVSMLVQYNELTKRNYAEMVDQLQLLVSKSKTSNPLAAELNIPAPIASSVVALTTKNMNDESLSSDTSTKTFQQFKIRADVTDVSHLDVLQNALINYLNNRPYIKKKRQEQLILFTDRLAFIDRELQKLDSLKTEYNRFLATSKISATFYNNAFDPAAAYVQSSQLASQREDLLRWLNIDRDAVSVVDGFKRVSVPRSFPLLITLLAFGFVGGLLAFLFAFMRQLKKAVSY